MRLGLLSQMLRFQNDGQTLLGQINGSRGGRELSHWLREDGGSKADVENEGRRRAGTNGESESSR